MPPSNSTKKPYAVINGPDFSFVVINRNHEVILRSCDYRSLSNDGYHIERYKNALEDTVELVRSYNELDSVFNPEDPKDTKD